jgi:hypothetical protein
MVFQCLEGSVLTLSNGQVEIRHRFGSRDLFSLDLVTAVAFNRATWWMFIPCWIVNISVAGTYNGFHVYVLGRKQAEAIQGALVH